ncbi:MAG: hypothetical protein ABJJ37_05785 [Roseibium sp.]
MTERYIFISDTSLQLAVDDVVKAAQKERMDHLPAMICYNIAQHTDPKLLRHDEAENFVSKMKELLGIAHVQRKLGQ